MKKFWNFIRNDDGERVLRLEGPIDEENFWGDSVTPDAFRDELEADEGDVTVWINSPGGNVFAAAEIYTMLKEHKGRITVKIDSIAASAASVVAMAGDEVLMSPVAMLMCHDPMTIAMGNTSDMEKAISTLNEVKESIINAYAAKTGMSRGKIAKLMSDETWMNARKAVEMGFADGILFAEDKKTPKEEYEDTWKPYSTRVMGQAILNKIISSEESDSLAEGAEEDQKAFPEPAAEATAEPSESGKAIAESDPEGQSGPADTDVADPETDTSDTTDPPVPLIGMDGRTEDGSMPYEILVNQLDYLR